MYCVGVDYTGVGADRNTKTKAAATLTQDETAESDLCLGPWRKARPALDGLLEIR
jgi:hypothetical protein